MKSLTRKITNLFDKAAPILAAAIVCLAGSMSVSAPANAARSKTIKSINTEFDNLSYAPGNAPTAAEISRELGNIIDVIMDDGIQDHLTIASWSDNGYNASQEGIYTFTPVILYADNYTFAKGVELPSVKVEIKKIAIKEFDQIADLEYTTLTVYENDDDMVNDLPKEIIGRNEKGQSVSVKVSSWTKEDKSYETEDAAYDDIRCYYNPSVDETIYDISNTTLPKVTVRLVPVVIKEITTEDVTYQYAIGAAPTAEEVLDNFGTGTVILKGGQSAYADLGWKCTNYDPTTIGTYVFTCNLNEDFTVEAPALPILTIEIKEPDAGEYAGLIRLADVKTGDDEESARSLLLSLNNLEEFSEVKSVVVTAQKPEGTLGEDYVDIGARPYKYYDTHYFSSVGWRGYSKTGEKLYSESRHGWYNTYVDNWDCWCDICNKNFRMTTWRERGGHGYRSKPSSHSSLETFDYTAHVYAWFDDVTGTLYIQNGDNSGTSPLLPTNSNNMFKDFTSLTNIDTSAFNASKIKSNTNFFQGCTSLTSITLGTDWEFKDAHNSGLQDASYPSGAGGFWYKEDNFEYDISAAEKKGVTINEDDMVETTLGYIDVFSLANYNTFALACNTLGLNENSEKDKNAYDFVREATGAAAADSGSGSNNRSSSWMYHNGFGSIEGFESNYNSKWAGTWITGFATIHRYWKTEGVANVNNMIEIHHPEAPFTTYCWAQHRGPNSGWYDRLQVTTEEQMIANLEVYHQKYRPIPSEKKAYQEGKTDSPMLRSFITIMYYGDITKNRINWGGLSMQERAYVTMSAVQYCSDSANYSYSDNHNQVDQILSKSYDSIPNVETVKFYIYLSTHEGGGQQQMGAESVQFNNYGGVEIKKVDTDGTPLQGAQFTVYTDAACKNVLVLGDGSKCIITTDNDGLASSCKMDDRGGIPVGTYYIKETKAPNASYLLSDDVFKFTVRKDHVTTVGYRNSNKSKESMIIVDHSELDVKYGTFKLTKESATKISSTVSYGPNGSIFTSPESGKGLSGAVYDVYANEDIKAKEKNGAHLEHTIYSKGDLVTTITTTYDGSASTRLITGSYYVKEKTAPGGYLISVEKTGTTITEGNLSAKTVQDEPKSGTFIVKAKKVIPGGYKIRKDQFTYELYMLTGSLDKSTGTPSMTALGVTTKNKAGGEIEFPEFTINSESTITYKDDTGVERKVQSSFAGEIQFAIKEVKPADADANGRYTYDDTVVYVVGAITENDESLDISLSYQYGLGTFSYSLNEGTEIDAAALADEIKSNLTEEEIKEKGMNQTLSGVTTGEKKLVYVKNNGDSTWTVKALPGASGETAILYRYIDDEGTEYDIPVTITVKNEDKGAKTQGIFCNVFLAPLPTPAPIKAVSQGVILGTETLGGKEYQTHNAVKYLDKFQYDVYQTVPKQSPANYYSAFVIKDTLPAGIYLTEQDLKVYKGSVDDTANWKFQVTHNNGATPKDQQYQITATYVGDLDNAGFYGQTYDLRYTVIAGHEVEAKSSFYNHAEVYITYKDIESMYALDSDGNVIYSTDAAGNELEMLYEGKNAYDNTSNDRGIDKSAGTHEGYDTNGEVLGGTAMENRLNDKFKSKTTDDENEAVYHRTSNEVRTDVYAYFDPDGYDDGGDPWGKPTWEIHKRVFDIDGFDVDTEDVHAGDVLSYVLYIRNNQSTADAHVDITDTLPSNVTFIDVDNGGVYNQATHTITWDDVDFDHETLLTITIHVKVNDVTRASDIDNKATATVTPDLPNDPNDTTGLARIPSTKTSNTVHNYVPGIVKIVTDKDGNNINGLFVNDGDTLYYHVFVINTDTASADPYRTGVHNFTTSDVIPDNSYLIGKAAEGRVVTSCPEPGVAKISMEGSNAVTACGNAVSVSWTEEFKPGQVVEYCFNVRATGDGVDIVNQGKTVKIKDSTVWNVYTSVVNGTITADQRSITPGEERTITYAPKAGYHLVGIQVDGKLISIEEFESSYKFENIQGDHYIRVVYAPSTSVPKTYTIVTEVVNGSIDKSIYNIVPGTDEKVSYIPDPKHHIVSVTVDGKEADPKTFSEIYAFDNVQADHAIKVVFAPDVDHKDFDKEDHTYRSNDVVNSTPLSVKKVMTLDGKDINKSFLMVGDTYYYTISVFNNEFGTKKYTITDVVPANITVTGIDDGNDINSRNGAGEGEIIKTIGSPVSESSVVATEVGTHSYKDHTITWVTELGPNETKTFTFTFTPDTKESEFTNDAHVKINQWATDPISGDPIPNVPDIPKEYDTNEVINWTPADPVKTVTRKTPAEDGKYEIQDMDTALVWGENADTLSYRISFSNNSKIRKTFVVTDKLDDDITFVRASNKGAYDKSTRTITWNIVMEPKSESYVTFDAKVSVGNNIASANNHATLIIDEAYPDSNETDTDIDETPTKTVYDAAGNDIDQFLVNQGDELTYTIRVKNPDELTKRFTVKDIVPENTELLSVKEGVYEKSEWSETTSERKDVSTFKISVAPGSTKTLTDKQVETLMSELSMTLVSNKDGVATLTANTKKVEDTISKIYEVIGEGYKITGSLDMIGAETSSSESEESDDVSYVLVDGEIVSDAGTHRYNVRSMYTAVVGENIPAGRYVLKSNGYAGHIVIKDADGETVANYKVGNTSLEDTNKTDTSTTFSGKETVSLKKGYTVTVTSKIGLVAYLTPSGSYTGKESYKDGDISADAIAAEGEEIVWTCDIPSGESYAFTFTVRTLKKDTYVPNEATVTVDKSSIKTNLVENWIPSDPMKGVTKDGVDVTKKTFFRPDEEHFTYEITVKNPSGIKKQFTVTDVLDEDLVFVKASDGGKLGDNNTVTWTVNVGGTQTKTLTVEVYIDSATGKSKIYNSAKVAADEFHYTTNTVVVYVTDPPVKEVLSGSKSIHEGLVFVGDTYTYKISWANPTEEDKNYTVTDVIPDGVEFVSCSNGGAESDGVITWSGIKVKAGSTGSVTFNVKVNKGTERKDIYNTANVAFTDNPKLYDHDTNEVKVTVGKITKDVEESQGGKSINGNIVADGQHFWYDIYVYNDSKKQQTVTVADTIDSKLTVVAASDGGEIDGQKIAWTDIQIPSGGTHLYVEVTPAKDTKSSGTEIKNTATITSKTTGGKLTSNEVVNYLLLDSAVQKSVTLTKKAETSDATSGSSATASSEVSGNADTSRTTVTTETTTDENGKSSTVTKTTTTKTSSTSSSTRKAAKVGETSTTGFIVDAGDTVTYTITVTNPAKEAKTFKVTDTVDARLTVESISDGGKISKDRVITWNVTIPAGATKTVTFEATAPVSEKTEIIDNKAIVTVDGVSKETNVVTIEVNPGTEEQIAAENPKTVTGKAKKAAKKVVRDLKTGDASNFTLWFAGIAAMAVGITAYVVTKKRKRA